MIGMQTERDNPLMADDEADEVKEAALETLFNEISAATTKAQAAGASIEDIIKMLAISISGTVIFAATSEAERKALLAKAIKSARIGLLDPRLAKRNGGTG